MAAFIRTRLRTITGAVAGLLATVALLLLASPAAAHGKDGKDPETPLTVKVTPHICFEGGAVRAQVRLPRDAANRAMRVEVDGEGYYSSSTVQLDGEASPAVYERRWLDLPAGSYVVQVLIIQADGATHGATTAFTVVDPRTTGLER